MTRTDGDDQGRPDDVRAVWRRDPEAAWALRRGPTSDGDGDGDAPRDAGGLQPEPADPTTPPDDLAR
jgi:hypothetical protein